MSNIFVFSTVSSSWAIIFDCVISFNELKTVLRCLAVTYVMSPLFDSSCFIILGGSVIFLVKLAANNAKSFIF